MSQTRRGVARVAPATVYVIATDLLTDPLDTSFNCSYQIEVAVSAAAVFYERVGGVNLELNNGVALQADRAYTFTILGHPDDPVNFRFSVGVTVRKFLVHEITGDVS